MTYLDRISAALSDWGFFDPGWTLKVNPLATHLDAVSKESYETPEEAFAEARRFAGTLADDVVAVVNRLDVGVARRPLEWWDGERWRATISAVLMVRERFEEDTSTHEINVG